MVDFSKYNKQKQEIKIIETPIVPAIIPKTPKIPRTPKMPTIEEMKKISIDDLSFYYKHITGKPRKHDSTHTRGYLIDEIIKVLNSTK